MIQIKRYIKYTIGIWMLQILLYGVIYAMQGSVLFLCILCIFLSICAIFTAETDMLRHRIKHLTEYMRYMIPLLIQILFLSAADTACMYFLRDYAEISVPWLIFSLLMLLLGGIAVFAVGAARTMLFHDD